MPSLNVRKYIRKCLESVINQTLRDIEIICIDAGSTDSTYEILEEYGKKDKRIKIIHSDFKSYGYQMNIGIEVATGKYIGIVETDDLIDADMFEKMYVTAEKYNVDYVKSSYKEFVECDDNVLINWNSIKHLPEQFVGRKIVLKDEIRARFIDPVHIWSGLYSKKFLDEKKIRFNETAGASFQDTSFSYLVGILADTCIYIENAFYCYRVDNDNSSVKSDSKIDCIINEFEFIEKELNNRNITDTHIVEEINKAKISTYMWNYNRLSDQSARIFQNQIYAEMDTLYNNKNFVHTLDETLFQYLKILLGKQSIEKCIVNENKQIENVECLITELNSGNNYIIVGAGDYANRIFLLSKAMKCSNILGVCDNGKHVIGNNFSGYKVYSVNDMVKQYPACKYIIANRKFALEISAQLTELGIIKDDIVICDDLPDWIKMISIYKNMRNEKVQNI